MKRSGLLGLVAVLALAVGIGSGSASAAGGKKLVEGTVFDETCAAVCCPPPCGPVPGPVPAPQSRSDVICAQAQIVCPLHGASPRICLPSSNCGGFPIYTGEGSLVNVRRRGSATVLARLPIVEGRFRIRLAPGEYVFHPYMAEEQCWSAEPVIAKVTAKLKSPVPVTLDATDRCVVHADAK
ncbi:MAG TPA: hypothetical protein VHA80_10965 [Solirubrobacterales bacterium]|nr:hypothetical protein [Solirubrobacterales bacterium]